MNITRFLTIVILSFGVSATSFGKIKIGIVPKMKNLDFYQQSLRGCQKFAKEQPEVECLYDGPKDAQDIRDHAGIVNRMVKNGVDGMLVAVIDSGFLVKNALKKTAEKGIPVFTYDADLDSKDAKYRVAYFGTNNFAFGEELGKAALPFKRKQGVTNVAFLTGHKDTPNLNERLRGVRSVLAGSKIEGKLAGENGWKEIARSPLLTRGDAATALSQVKYFLNLPAKDRPLLIAVAGFAQFTPKYAKEVARYKSDFDSKKMIFVCADTEPVQIDALGKGLSTVNIGQRPFDMGYLGAKKMYELIKNKKRPDEFNYVEFHHCTPENAKTCKKS